MTFYRHSIVIVEDEPKIRRNIANKIESSGHPFHVIGHASNGEEGLLMIHELLPDVVFTDIKMPRMDGIELIRRIKNDFPEIRFVILSGYNDFEYAKLAMKMNVSDYLLKPLNLNALDEVLQNLNRSLTLKNKSMSREILTCTIHCMPMDISSSNHLIDEFMVFLICIGNLSVPIAPPHQVAFFQELWGCVSFDSILNRLLHDQEHWFVIDEKVANQKFVLISANNRSIEEINLITEKLQVSLSDCIKQLPITIAYYDAIVKRSDILEKAQYLRKLLDRELVIGKSITINAATTTSSTTPLNLVNQIFQNKISTYIQSGEINLLQQELYSVYDSWVLAEHPQRLLEKTMNHILRLIVSQTGQTSESEMYGLEYEIFANMATSSDPSNFLHEIWGLIEGLITIREENEDIYKQIEHIMNFIELNYAKEINLEQLAKKYHFTPSTFSKLVKKYYGETPLKYIIKLRVQEAQRLIRENPQQEVWKIAEIVGYTDQHYFSRIFKSTLGMSPSEFRDSLRQI